METTGLKHDGPIGVNLEDKRFILVADRTYFSMDKVIRLKENIHLNRKKSLKRAAVTDSNVTADFTCILGTTENAVYSQLFAALIAYVLLKFLQTEGHKKKHCKRLSFAGFTRQFICDTLPIEWRIGLKEIVEFHRELYQIDIG